MAAACASRGRPPRVLELGCGVAPAAGIVLGGALVLGRPSPPTHVPSSTTDARTPRHIWVHSDSIGPVYVVLGLTRDCPPPGMACVAEGCDVLFTVRASG